MEWETVSRKFDQLSQASISPRQQRAIQEAVANLENIQVRELTSLLGKIEQLPKEEYI
jgi:hypothetical protein